MGFVQGVNVKWDRTEVFGRFKKGSPRRRVAAVDVLLDGGLSVAVEYLQSGSGAIVRILNSDREPVGTGIVSLSILIGSVLAPVGGGRKYRVANGSKGVPSLVFIDTVLPAGYVGNSVTAVVTLTAWPKDGIEITFPADELKWNGGVTPPGGK